jgi:hypothetical protein
MLAQAAIRLAADQPAACEQVLDLIKNSSDELRGLMGSACPLARVDLPRARRLVDRITDPDLHAQALLLLANGVARGDHAGASAIAREAIAEFDRNRAEPSNPLDLRRAEALPLVEHVDPTLVPELFWLAMEHRRFLPDPRAPASSATILPLLLARYDHDVAAAQFESATAAARASDPRGGEAMSPAVISTMAVIDPRGAAKLVESMPPQKDNSPGSRNVRRYFLAESLGQPTPAMWRSIWDKNSLVGSWVRNRELY